MTKIIKRYTRYNQSVCRNIRRLFNYEPPATEKEIYDASLQFVRKISGFRQPSKVNKEIFEDTIDQISEVIQSMLDNLVTSAAKRNREVDRQKRIERNKKRFS